MYYNQYANNKQQNRYQKQNKKKLFPLNFIFDQLSQCANFRQNSSTYEYPFNQQSTNNKQQTIQPPSFLKAGYLDGKIDEHDDLYEKYHLSVIRSATQSEKKSQGISINQVNEQYPPFLMSNLNYNFKRNLNNLLIVRVKDNMQQLRQAQSDILSYVQQIKTAIEFYKAKICLQVQEFMKKQSLSGNAILVKQIHQSRRNISDLDRDIKSRNQQIYQLNYELNETKDLLQKQMHKNKSLIKIKNSKYGERQQRQAQMERCINCSKCQIFSIKSKSLIEQIKRIQQQKENLLIQNQNLQQYIFDIEQKIVGIDLEVQKRLRHYLQSMPQSNSHYQDQSKDYIIIIQKLNDQNMALQQKIHRYQQICIRQQEINQRQVILKEKEVNYRLREESLLQSIAKNQEIKENNNFREHQISLAEENLCAKIKQLMTREKQLESEEELWHNNTDTKHFTSSRQMKRSLTSIQPWNNEEISFMHIDKQNNSQKMLKKSEKIYPESPHIKQLNVKSNTDAKVLNKNYYIQNQQFPARPRYSEKTIKINSPRNVEIKAGNNFIKQSPPAKFRQSSKGSLASNHKIMSVNQSFQLKRPQMPRQSPQAYGLGNKLQRLRKQIKKEIEAIK